MSWWWCLSKLRTIFLSLCLSVSLALFFFPSLSSTSFYPCIPSYIRLCHRCVVYTIVKQSAKGKIYKLNSLCNRETSFNTSFVLPPSFFPPSLHNTFFTEKKFFIKNQKNLSFSCLLIYMNTEGEKRIYCIQKGPAMN